MKRSQITKLYISNFLIGLVFWYGIEKLFMNSIGIDAVGVGIAVSLLAVLNLVLDIPAGVLADKWSRKGVLCISAVSLAVGSIILGLSNGLTVYLIGYAFYSLYVVANNGTYQAIVYDTLHEEGRASQYSKVIGRASAMMLIGAAVANVFSGFLANKFGYSFDFMITVVPCMLNVLVVASVREPQFHKAENKEKILTRLGASIKALIGIRLLRGLAVVMSAFAVVEIFKGEFGQLFLLRYASGPELIGLLWAAYAIAWAFGNAIAHRLHDKLNMLIFMSVAPLLLMSVVDNWLSVVIFMVQVIASAAMLNHIETKIQDNTPSSVRASMISVLASLGRLIVIPSGLVIGWLIRDYDVIWALRFVSLLALLSVTYYMANNKFSKPSVAVLSE